MARCATSDVGHPINCSLKNILNNGFEDDAGESEGIFGRLGGLARSTARYTVSLVLASVVGWLIGLQHRDPRHLLIQWQSARLIYRICMRKVAKGRRPDRVHRLEGLGMEIASHNVGVLHKFVR
jgi:hypothetical protein